MILQQMATKTDVKVSESETTVGLQDSIKETTRRSTNDLRTEIIEEDGLVRSILMLYAHCMLEFARLLYIGVAHCGAKMRQMRASIC